MELLHSVSIWIDANEDETDVGKTSCDQASFDLLHIVDENGAGKMAGGKKHRDDLRSPTELVESKLFIVVRGPIGFNLVKGGIGERSGGCRGIGGTTGGRSEDAEIREKKRD